MTQGYIDESGNLTREGERSLAGWRLTLGRLDELEKLGPITPEDHWLFPGFVSTSNTLIYGQSKAGKSFLVSSLVASLVDGTAFLGRKPLKSGLKVLVLSSDAGGMKEYQERLAEQVTNQENVYLDQLNGMLTPDDWDDYRAGVESLNLDVVIVDHATGVIRGEFNQREPWLDLWDQLNAFGDGVARVLVGHATDSKFEGSPIHRPMGSAAATLFARARVYLWAPMGLKHPSRKVELVSNNAQSEEFKCLFVDKRIVLDEGEDERDSERADTRNRSGAKGEVLSRLIDLAITAKPMPQKDCHRWLSEQEGVLGTNGDPLSPDTIRNRLRQSGAVKWNRKAQRYERK